MLATKVGGTPTTDTTVIAPAPAHPGRQALLWTLKIVVSGGLMYWLLRGVDLEKLWGTAQAASFSWFLAALAIYTVVVVVSAWRWGLLLHAQHVPLSFWSLTQSFLVATFFNNFLPSNIGGDVIRIHQRTAMIGELHTTRHFRREEWIRREARIDIRPLAAEVIAVVNDDNLLRARHHGVGLL